VLVIYLGSELPECLSSGQMHSWVPVDGLLYGESWTCIRCGDMVTKVKEELGTWVPTSFGNYYRYEYGAPREIQTVEVECS
jgi:hypothetical protein